MKVKKFLQLFDNVNLDAEVVFLLSDFPGVSILSKVDCKCKQKEIYFKIGKNNFKQ